MDAVKLLLSTVIITMCLTAESSFAKPPAQPQVNKPTCEPNAIFSTKIERRYIQTQKKSETHRQQYVLSDYVAQTNVAAAGYVQFKSGEYGELDEANLLNTGSSESITSFEISEDGSLYIGYVRDPKTQIEIPAAPNMIVSAPDLAQSLIFDPVDVLKAQEIAFSPKEVKDAIETIRIETESAEEDIKICNGKIETLIFTSRPTQNSKSDKTVQVNIELEVQL